MPESNIVFHKKYDGDNDSIDSPGGLESDEDETKLSSLKELLDVLQLKNGCFSVG